MEKYRVKVKRPYRGLHEGDVLVLNPTSGMFELREQEEVVADNYQSKNSRIVSFSTSFIEKFLDQVFEDLDGLFSEVEEEKEPEQGYLKDSTTELRENEYKYSLDVTRFKDLIELVEELQKEVEELKVAKVKKAPKKAKR